MRHSPEESHAARQARLFHLSLHGHPERPITSQVKFDRLTAIFEKSGGLYEMFVAFDLDEISHRYHLEPRVSISRLPGLHRFGNVYPYVNDVELGRRLANQGGNSTGAIFTYRSNKARLGRLDLQEIILADIPSMGRETPRNGGHFGSD